jgi:bifunctional non-homologous end joining protein LigD
MSLGAMKRRLAAFKAAFIEPCLPTVAVTPPRGAGWIHEIKHDGFRLQARRDANGVHLITRNGFDWTERYPSIARAMKVLPCKSCIIDGEVVVVDEQGIATFDRLRYGPREKSEAMLYAFDLLELDGEDLRRRPIEARKLKLEEVLSFRPSTTGSKRTSQIDRLVVNAIRLVEHLELDDAEVLFQHACALGCEGIVSKRRGSRYRSGRSRDWIKVKNPAAPASRRLDEEDWNDRRK